MEGGGGRKENFFLSLPVAVYSSVASYRRCQAISPPLPSCKQASFSAQANERRKEERENRKGLSTLFGIRWKEKMLFSSLCLMHLSGRREREIFLHMRDRIRLFIVIRQSFKTFNESILEKIDNLGNIGREKIFFENKIKGETHTTFSPVVTLGSTFFFLPHFSVLISDSCSFFPPPPPVFLFLLQE